MCKSRAHSRDTAETLKTLLRGREASFARECKDWAKHTTTGDKSELPFEVPPHIWRLLSSTADDCIKPMGSHCHKGCFAEAARAAFHAADIVVCNYHLLCAHLAVLRKTQGKYRVLPHFDVAVCDEGHRLASIARDFFGFQVSQGAVFYAGKPLASLDAPGADTAWDHLKDAANEFFGRLAVYRDGPTYKTRIRQPNVVDPTKLVEALVVAGETLVKEMLRIPDGMEATQLNRNARRCGELAEQITAGMTLSDTNAAVFVETAKRGDAVLCSKPVEVGDTLQQELFGPLHCSTLTSATLTTSRTFVHIKRETGIKPTVELEVESPFDIAQRVFLIVPESMPGVKSPDFYAAVASHVYQATQLAKGRTLALFTSYRSLETAATAMSVSPYRVLVQGTMPRTQLVEEFKRDVSSVLLGTESFWAGVDVPGEALSCVVIDRLPFLTPNDPILDAIQERYGDSFQRYSIPHAAIQFKQGFGRLMRRVDDCGVVVCLDRRVTNSGYGRVFLKSLPKVTVGKSMAAVGNFLTLMGKG